MTVGRVGALVLASLSLLGCPRRSDPPNGGTSSAQPSAVPGPVASGVPLDPKLVSAAVNPEGKAEYSGPVGVVEGRVVATGDPPFEQAEVAKQIPESCKGARPFYATIFREGEGRALADVLVGITGYREYIPAKEPAKRFVAKDCTFGTRTIALTYGQRLEVVSGDREAYVPELLGETGQAQIVATPGGEVASTLYPTRAGRFVLIDNIKLFMTAEVLVLKYATVSVTGADGRYRISGLPPGELALSALLPATGKMAQKKITVEAGKTLTADLEIPFDAKAYRQAAAVPSGAPSSKPAPSSKAAASSKSAAPKAAPSASARR
jgi:hypothetical protein